MNSPSPEQTYRYVSNAGALLGHGYVALRRDALSILDRVLVEADPYRACLKAVRLEGDELTIAHLKLKVPASARIWFFGAGKASFQIARGIEDKLRDRLHSGLVVCKEGQEGSLRRIDILYASHPIPSEASIAAGREMIHRTSQPRAGDIVLCGITGGSSALLTMPGKGLGLADLQSLTKILLTCGANIFEINAVRKHVSEVGGGRLAQKFDPGVHLINITVSDVIGDALDYITDPTVADTSTIAHAHLTLDRYDLWQRISPAVRAYLSTDGGVSETPKKLPWPAEYNVLLLPASSPVEIAQRAASAIGYKPIVLSASFDGESRSLGENFAAIAREVAQNRQPVDVPCALIGGGETIVRMNGFGGFGGPNQEFALAGARHLPNGQPAVILGADTDGTDGPTQVAGALCDLSTISRGANLGIDLEEALDGHNVTPALLKLDDVIITGATGTNVNDLKLLLLG